MNEHAKAVINSSIMRAEFDLKNATEDVERYHAELGKALDYVARCSARLVALQEHAAEFGFERDAVGQ